MVYSHHQEEGPMQSTHGKEEQETGRPEDPSSWKKPAGSAILLELKKGAAAMHYQARADWIVLHKDEKPKAELFFIAYTAVTDDTDENGESGDGVVRPLTFVFNGGPGASSVYLHLGAMGPKRIETKENGLPLPPPNRLVNNPESWLAFTDLVFIDPIGTGFSRMIDESQGEKDGDKDAKKQSGSANDGEKGSEYWQVKRDLEALGEGIRRYLNIHHRWESPIYIAGESYGGFRTAKLAKMAQQDYGIPLSGAIIISPALEFTLLDGSDYDVLMWIDSFPSMAAAAWVHGKSRKKRAGEELDAFRLRAAEFAVKELLPVLAAGDMYGSERKTRVLNLAADFLGLPRQLVQGKNGRVGIEYFVKNLLRQEGKQLGLYDAAVAVTDPYPDRDSWVGPDPTLHHLERVFSAGINTQLRTNIGLKTDREYDLLSEEVNKGWKVDTRNHALESQVGATDDLRYGMSLNPDMKVYITHGIFDLVTPYFAAERITRLMKLTEEQKKQLTLKHYTGGHMFYVRSESRRAFFRDMQQFYKGN